MARKQGRVTLIHNDKAGNGRHRREELVELLEAAGYVVTYFAYKHNDWQKALGRPAELVVAAGGDGTIAKVAARGAAGRPAARHAAARHRQQPGQGSRFLPAAGTAGGGLVGRADPALPPDRGDRAVGTQAARRGHRLRRDRTGDRGSAGNGRGRARLPAHGRCGHGHRARASRTAARRREDRPGFCPVGSQHGAADRARTYGWRPRPIRRSRNFRSPLSARIPRSARRWRAGSPRRRTEPRRRSRYAPPNTRRSAAASAGCGSTATSGKPRPAPEPDSVETITLGSEAEPIAFLAPA